MRHYATGWLLPDVLGALGPSALAAVPAPRRCAVGSYDTWWAPVWKSTFTVHPTHWLISTQVGAVQAAAAGTPPDRAADPEGLRP